MTSYHERLNVDRMSFGTSRERTANIKSRLDEERAVYRSSPKDSYNETMAAKNISDLEKALVQSEANDRARTDLEQSIEAKRKQAAEREDARRAAQGEEVKNTLMARYLALPRTTEAQFEADYPALLADHRRQEMGRLEQEGQAQIARTIRRIF